MKINNNLNVPRLIRKIIRQIARVSYNYPIRIVEGNKPPILEGTSYYYTNKRGDIIYHPSAYKRAWGKPIYHNSTLRIEVGQQWFNSNMSINDIRKQKLKAFS